MLYKVKAKINKLQMKAFYTALTDGSIAALEPDGPDIVNAMQKAIKTEDDTLEWYESCMCETPLEHERDVVYNQYLQDIETTLVYEIKDDIKGTSFWDCLENWHFDDIYTF